MSNDYYTFANSACHEEYAIKRREDMAKMKARLREESKRLEKLRLCKKLEAERTRLQKLMEQKKQGSHLAHIYIKYHDDVK